MVRHVQEEDFDKLPVRPKEKRPREPQAALEALCRTEVLKSPEDWITDRFLAACLQAGTKHIGTILQKLTEEGILSELVEVPTGTAEIDDLQVKVHRSSWGGHHSDLSAFFHDGKWCVGYFDRSTSDARKTSLFHGRPDIYRYRRARGIRGTLGDRPTAKTKQSFQDSFRYKEADWDGKARRLLRNSQAFIDACLDAGIEPQTDLPWDCVKCGRRNSADESVCTRSDCRKGKPKLLKKPEPKVCPKCGRPDLDGHSKRHRGSKSLKARHECMALMVEAVHKV